MFSMTSASELRQRAEQSQKQQGRNLDTDSTATSLKEEKSEEQLRETECTAGTGRVAEEDSSLAEQKQVLPGAALGNVNKAVEHKGECEEYVMSDELVDEFFRVTTEKLMSAEKRKEIRQKVTPEKRIPALLLDIQNDQLEVMGIERAAGKEALNRYARTTAMENKQAHDKMDDFTQTCQRTYIELLREMEPQVAETEAKMTPEQIIEFFEACDTLMALSETKMELRKEFLETEEPPDATIVGMQRKMLRTLGMDPEHGVSCLNTFTEDYPNETKLQQRSQQFMRCASMARQEAMLGKEEMTKRMQMQQMAMMKQHRMAMELEALDAAGREELTKRVEEMQQKHAVAIQTLSTADERTAYVMGIPEEEQWEIAKLQMLRMQAMAGAEGAHGHNHAHGEHCTGHGHDHGHTHGHNHVHAEALNGAHSHSHSHGHGNHAASHDHKQEPSSS